MYSKNQQVGFTLIELMVAVAILAIVLGVGIPSYRDLMVNNRMAGEINDFVGSLQIARSEAIKRGINIQICASSNGTKCATKGNWNQGWIIASTEAPPTDVLRTQEAWTSGDTLKGAGNVLRAISFDRNGLATGDDSLPPAVSGKDPKITLCDADSDDSKARAVEIGFTGQVTLKKHADFPDDVTCS